jgi:acetyl-CoA carboxylase biotin carboxylase subunit
MVAKLIAWGLDRSEAIDRLRRALAEFVVKGIKTSIPFHQRVLRHPRFLAGQYDTGFIEAHLHEVSDEGAHGEERRAARMLAAVAAYRRDKARAERATSAGSAAGESPWRAFGKRSAMRGWLR